MFLAVPFQFLRVDISDSKSFEIFEFCSLTGDRVIYFCFSRLEQRQFLRKASITVQSGSNPFIIGYYGTTHFSFVAHSAAMILQLFMMT